MATALVQQTFGLTCGRYPRAVLPVSTFTSPAWAHGRVPFPSCLSILALPTSVVAGAVTTITLTRARAMLARRRLRVFYIRSNACLNPCVATTPPASGLPSQPRWLGGGLEEVVEEYQGYIIDGLGVLHDGARAFPWALDCLNELRAAGATIVVVVDGNDLEGNTALAELGIIRGQNFDAVMPRHVAIAESIDAWLAQARSTAGGERALMVTSFATHLPPTYAVGIDAALVCTGEHSSDFGLAKAPQIDVPANGGHFVEPDCTCWDLALGDTPRPELALACFSFSHSFFFRFFAERRARARSAHARRQQLTNGVVGARDGAAVVDVP